MFKNFIGIDYSGAKNPISRLAQLQVYLSDGRDPPRKVEPLQKGKKNWCRQEVASYIRQILISQNETIIGIDHGLSFPYAYFIRNNLKNWHQMLRSFSEKWMTNAEYSTVDEARARVGSPGGSTEYRLTEKWTSSAKSVFHFDVQGSVAKSTHAGLPWINEMYGNKEITERTHFWPFDGFDVKPGKNVVAEIFPSSFRRRYEKKGRSSDEHDAFVVSAWLRDTCLSGNLKTYFKPLLSESEKRKVLLEGWILGVL